VKGGGGSKKSIGKKNSWRLVALKLFEMCNVNETNLFRTWQSRLPLFLHKSLNDSPTVFSTPHLT
jgi:hypothetical protein